MQKYLIPVMIYGNWDPVLRLIGNILIIGYFLVPHIGAQISDAQVEARLDTIEYRLSRIERSQEKQEIGWDKVGTICGVLALVGGLCATYIKGQIKINISQFALEVSKDIHDKFVSAKSYDSGMKHILDELATIKEEQRRRRV